MAVKTVKVKINGVEHNLTYNSSSGKWESTLTAPSASSFNQSGGYYGVQVKATDVAGNIKTVDDTDTTLGSSLKLVVKENVKPTITITNPGAGSYITNNKPTITVQLRDDDSGIKISTFSLQVDALPAVNSNSQGVTITPATGGYDVSYKLQTALSDGSHTIKVNVSDNDGNTATQATRTFTIDTLPPSLDVTSPIDGLITNSTSWTVSGYTHDEHQSPVVVKIRVNDVDQGNVSVVEGNFSKTVALTEGLNTIIVSSSDTLDQTTSVTRLVTRDTVAPSVTGVEIAPNPVDSGQTFIIKVTVVD